MCDSDRAGLLLYYNAGSVKIEKLEGAGHSTQNRSPEALQFSEMCSLDMNAGAW